MATRFYTSGLAGAGTPAVNATDWPHNSNVVRLQGATTRGMPQSTMATSAVTYDGSDHLVDMNAIYFQVISKEQLYPQTISAQTIKWQYQCLEANNGNNLFLTVKVYVVAGSTVKETLLAIQRDGTEMLNSLINRGDSGTTTEATVEQGDRIVIEIGAGGTPTATGGVQGHNFSLRYGTIATSGDLPEDDSTTATSYRGWIEFANDLKFGWGMLAADRRFKLVRN